MLCCCKRTEIIAQFVQSVINGGGTASVPGMRKDDIVQAGIMSVDTNAVTGVVSATAADNGVVYTNNTGVTVRVSTLVLRKVEGGC